MYSGGHINLPMNRANIIMLCQMHVFTTRKQYLDSSKMIGRIIRRQAKYDPRQQITFYTVQKTLHKKKTCK